MTLHTQQQNYPLAVALLISEILLGFLLASIVKMLGQDLAIFQILFFRYLFSLPILILWARFAVGPDFLRISNKRIMALRSLCGFMGLMMWFIAISNIDLSLATALGNTMPMFITLLLVLLGHEIVGVRRVMAVGFGFLGVFILLLPISNDFNWLGTVSALLGAIFAALMFIFIRILGRSDAAVATAIWYNGFGACASGILCVSLTQFDLNLRTDTNGLNTFLWLVGLGAIASFQQFALAQSHYYAEASALAPIHYLSIPIGVGYGVFLFDESLSLRFLIGTAIIIAANIFIFLRERRRQIFQSGA